MSTVALLWHGDREARDRNCFEGHRLAPTAEALRSVGLNAVPAVYRDDFRDEVFEQLCEVDAVLTWVNPIEEGVGRDVLDAMLREVAVRGTLVSAHPHTIQRMGTKEVLFDTREMEWGADVRCYRSLEEFRSRFPATLAEGRPRVLKRRRGHSGHGVWKVTPTAQTGTVLLRHAARGCTESETSLEALFEAMAPYLEADAFLADQPYFESIANGMVRAYFVKDRVEGFGHQAVNALVPGAGGTPPPEPGPRLYHPPDLPEFQGLKHKLEGQWLAEMQQVLGLTRDDLPFLWDADFFPAPASDGAEKRFVLCEINVSSVFPYPDSAMLPLAHALREALLNKDGGQ